MSLVLNLQQQLPRPGGMEGTGQTSHGDKAVGTLGVPQSSSKLEIQRGFGHQELLEGRANLGVTMRS